MARSFSIFFFPIGHGPDILLYKSRSPVISLQRYIDDNTTAGPGHDMFLVNKVEKCCQYCRSAGFQIEQHSCWQAMSTDCPPFPLQSLLGQRESEAILRQQTYPTARPAILSAILSEKRSYSRVLKDALAWLLEKLASFPTGWTTHKYCHC